MIYRQYLGFGKDGSGEKVWICRHCNLPADEAKGAGDRDQLVYVLMCPAGRITLGEWATAEEKQMQLTAYAAELAGR